jgi:malonyl-CoA decarboxylase
VKLVEFLKFKPSRGVGEGTPAPARKAIAHCHRLLESSGEVSGARTAKEALTTYQSLDAPSRESFFDLLLSEFSPDPQKVGQAGDAYRKEPSAANLARLQQVVEPPRRELFQRLNMAPGGTRVLLDMRSWMLHSNGRASDWQPIASDLAHLFNAWFNRGLLMLQRIDWRTSATILEKLIEYEAVHQIQGWPDLRRRLEADRRCYGFFHPALPEEPVIFIEAALARGIPDKVQPLIDPTSPVVSPSSADCAVFYSITNCQDGLRGVPLGSFLIKQVVEDLQRELPRLRTFATLSPVPGFREWLVKYVAENSAKLPELNGVLERLSRLNWPDETDVAAQLREDLIPLCAHYLLNARKGQEPLDSVARFHLRNGARLERINWLGDTSPTGMRRSAGLMTNYVYRLGDLEQNHERYTREGRVAVSYEVESLARQLMKKKPGKERSGKNVA